MTLEEMAIFIWSKCNKKQLGIITGYSFDNDSPDNAKDWIAVIEV